MTIDEVRGLIASVTYKRGWSFTVEPFGFDVAMIEIRFNARDANDQTKELQFSTRHPLALSHIPSKRGLLNRLRSYILHIEMHELDEFLKVDGVAPFDPHRSTPPW